MNIREYYSDRHIDPLRPYTHGCFLDLTWRVRNSLGRNRDRKIFQKGLGELSHQLANDPDISSYVKSRIGRVLQKLSETKTLKEWFKGGRGYNGERGRIERLLDSYESRLMKMAEDICISDRVIGALTKVY